MAKKIIYILVTLVIGVCSMNANILWVFESSESVSTQPNKSILLKEDIKKILEEKQAVVVYIDINGSPSYLQLLKSLKASTVPTIFLIDKKNQISYFSNILTIEQIADLKSEQNTEHPKKQ